MAVATQLFGVPRKYQLSDAVELAVAELVATLLEELVVVVPPPQDGQGTPTLAPT